MADNTQLDSGTGGDLVVTREISHGGDTAKLQGQFVMGISGTEGSYTAAAINGDATNGLDVDVTRVSGTVTVDGSGVTQPVSGTVTANLGATDNAVLDSIDAAVNGTLTVGSHAVTNAGTFAVQAAQSGSWTATAVGAAAENAAVSGNPVLVGGRYDSSARTLGNGDAGALALNASGHALVEVSGFTNSVTDDAAFTAGTTQVSVVGYVFDDSAPDSVDEGDAGAPRMSANRVPYSTIRDAAGNERGVNVDASNRMTVVADLGSTDNAVLDSIVTNTNKGTSHYRNIDANAESEIKGSGGTLHWIHAINLTNAIAYLHLYDATAASVTPGSTTPTFTFPVPTTGTASQGGGFNLRLEHAFANGITLVCTTTTDGSTGDPGTNGVMVNAGYT